MPLAILCQSYQSAEHATQPAPHSGVALGVLYPSIQFHLAIVLEAANRHLEPTSNLSKSTSDTKGGCKDLTEHCLVLHPPLAYTESEPAGAEGIDSW
jgi:hypothetical protein